jgi:hypothetical protein
LQDEKLSEKLSTIRQHLQSILSCIFSLRIFDKGKIMASTSKIRGKEEEEPRKTKQRWKSPLEQRCRTLIHALRALNSSHSIVNVTIYQCAEFGVLNPRINGIRSDKI